MSTRRTKLAGWNLGKLGPKWEGSYLVVEAYQNGSYKLRTMDDREAGRKVSEEAGSTLGKNNLYLRHHFTHTSGASDAQRWKILINNPLPYISPPFPTSNRIITFSDLNSFSITSSCSELPQADKSGQPEKNSNYQPLSSLLPTPPVYFASFFPGSEPRLNS
ncbi:hypothetical protein Tco_1382691 [Tanacetum coccineum]